MTELTNQELRALGNKFLDAYERKEQHEKQLCDALDKQEECGLIMGEYVMERDILGLHVTRLLAL